MFRERFSSKVTLHPQDQIDVEYINGPFRYLNNHWQFEPHPDGCIVDFYVDFEFRSRILQNLIGLLFNEAVRRMVAAFEARARSSTSPSPPRPATPWSALPPWARPATDSRCPAAEAGRP